jgi:hypothetical protein
LFPNIGIIQAIHGILYFKCILANFISALQQWLLPFRTSSPKTAYARRNIRRIDRVFPIGNPNLSKTRFWPLSMDEPLKVGDGNLNPI